MFMLEVRRTRVMVRLLEAFMETTRRVLLPLRAPQVYLQIPVRLEVRALCLTRLPKGLEG